MNPRHYKAIYNAPMPPEFIEAIVLKRAAERRGRWPAVKAVLQADPDIWDDFIFERGIRLTDLARLLASALGVTPEQVGDFARDAVGRSER